MTGSEADMGLKILKSRRNRAKIKWWYKLAALYRAGSIMLVQTSGSRPHAETGNEPHPLTLARAHNLRNLLGEEREVA